MRRAATLIIAAALPALASTEALRSTAAVACDGESLRIEFPQPATAVTVPLRAVLRACGFAPA